ncbi:uncharacterized protein LOC131264365 [Anopheles coustani]|uniref:uncharacterized protein LOC131264365 n=1 Tax=Anopheles coustani TaxID=139045 RepID=UPI002659B5A0|nr:uncharacterized protein LOC131264365 [Anopheles coustani]
MLTLVLSFGLLHVCVSASGGVPESPAQTPEIGNDAAPDDDDDTRNYMRLDENDLAPPSSTVGGHEKGGDGPYRPWRLHPSPELLDALRAALAVESEVMELHNAKGNSRDDSYDIGRTSGDWTLGLHDGGLFGYGGERQLPKRAPTGFTGMRGRRIPSGFNGMRGKKSLSLFSWNNQALQADPKSYRDGKRAPSGFIGMRGKKSFDTSLDEQWSMDDLSLARQAKEYPNFLILEPTFGAMNPAPFKRVPNGFMGLRGKK